MAESTPDPGAAGSDALTPYQKKLFIFLSVATFFEGFDFIALSQVLPELIKEFELSEEQAGVMVSVAKLGTVAAFFLVRAADRWGRKNVLTITIAGYTISTFLTAISPNVWVFAIVQLLAHMFLIAEGATAMVLASEEFPAARRGMVIGVIQAFSSLGAITCAGVEPMITAATSYGWRSIYFIGILPLIILAYARRGLKESRRFLELKDKRQGDEKRSLLAALRSPFRNRIFQLGLIWTLTFFCTNNAVTWWKKFVMTERGFTSADAGGSIALAAVAAMPLVFLAGKLLDVIGRRKGAVVIFLVSTVGVFSSYGLHGRWALTFALILGIFGASAVLPVLNAFTTELVPTEIRGDTFAWANNILGRFGYVIGPSFVGAVAARYSWSLAVQLTSGGLVLALVLILLWLPETNNKELEEAAGL